MAITDEQVRALGAYLSQRPTDAIRHHESLGRSDGSVGYAELVASAFIIAARRRFVPPWSRAAVIRYVADVRRREISHDDFDPLTAETITLRALGVRDDADLDEEQRIRSEIFLLEALVLDAGLQPADIDTLLTEARLLAPNLFSRDAGTP